MTEQPSRPYPPTCREKQDAAIAELQDAIKARLYIDNEVIDEINDLRARVAILEAHYFGTGALLAADLDTAAITWYGNPPAAVSVAGTPGTSWQPGGWVDQYADAVDD
jgi:hypothetical protein